VTLGRDTAGFLLRRTWSTYRVQLVEAVLAGLGWAFGRCAGRRSLVVTSIHHGRTTSLPGVDLGRTVGWLATRVPVVMHMPAAERFSDAIGPIGEQVRGIPGGGSTYLSFCYAGPPDQARAIGSLLERADLTLNFVGREEPDLPASGLVSLAGEHVSLFDNLPARPQPRVHRGLRIHHERRGRPVQLDVRRQRPRRGEHPAAGRDPRRGPCALSRAVPSSRPRRR